MKTLKHKHWYDEIYDVHYVFLLNISKDSQVNEILKKNYKHTYKYYKEQKNNHNVSIENSSGKNIQSRYRQIILVRKMKKYDHAIWYGILAHECLHAMLYIFNDRGVKNDGTGYNEHFTYYLESLIRKSLEK